MTAQEFVQYMSAEALAATIDYVWDQTEPNETSTAVIRTCWLQLVALVGEEDAKRMIFGREVAS